MASNSVDQYVFGYGSLVEAIDAGGRAAHLAGHRRRWQVAMDNSRDLPGYKYFVDAATGERPAVRVAFLDLAPDPECAVNGIAFPVTDSALEALDRRERNYERRDVTDRVDPPIGGRVWAYFGSAAARERFRRGSTVVSRSYLDLVRAGFESLGAAALRQFDASTDDPPVPVRDLRRIDIPLSG